MVTLSTGIVRSSHEEGSVVADHGLLTRFLAALAVLPATVFTRTRLARTPTRLARTPTRLARTLLGTRFLAALAVLPATVFACAGFARTPLGTRFLTAFAVLPATVFACAGFARTLTRSPSGARSPAALAVLPATVFACARFARTLTRSPSGARSPAAFAVLFATVFACAGLARTFARTLTRTPFVASRLLIAFSSLVIDTVLAKFNPRSRRGFFAAFAVLPATVLARSGLTGTLANVSLTTGLVRMILVPHYRNFFHSSPVSRGIRHTFKLKGFLGIFEVLLDEQVVFRQNPTGMFFTLA